jgi:hypothetical protein
MSWSGSFVRNSGESYVLLESRPYHATRSRVEPLLMYFAHQFLPDSSAQSRMTWSPVWPR